MVIERLKEYVDAKGITVRALELKSGISNGTIGKALKPGATMRVDALEKILLFCTDLNPTWLMTGKGEMFGGVSALEKEVERLKEENKRLREIKIPVADAAPMAEVWMKFMENQRQYNQIMSEMVKLYDKTK